MIAINFFVTIINCHHQLFSHEGFFCLLISFPFTVKHPGDVGLHVTSLPPGVVPSQDSHCGPSFPSPAPRSALFSVFLHSEGKALPGGDLHRLCCRSLPPDSILCQGCCCSHVFVTLPVTNWSLSSAPLLAVLQAGPTSWACLQCRCTGPVLRRASAWVWCSLVTVLTLLII